MSENKPSRNAPSNRSGRSQGPLSELADVVSGAMVVAGLAGGAFLIHWFAAMEYGFAAVYALILGAIVAAGYWLYRQS